MSHYSLLVVTDKRPDMDDLHQILLPWHEYECTGINEHLEFVDETGMVIRAWEDPEDLDEGDPAPKEQYKDIDEFAREVYGFERNAQGRWGYMTNPDKKWDWWEVGGRWTGMIPNNQCQKRSLDKVPTPFAVVKDGVWTERGEMGWFGTVTDGKEQDDWAEEFQKLMDTAPDSAWLTLVDCHI